MLGSLTIFNGTMYYLDDDLGDRVTYTFVTLHDDNVLVTCRRFIGAIISNTTVLVPSYTDIRSVWKDDLDWVKEANITFAVVTVPFDQLGDNYYTLGLKMSSAEAALFRLRFG